MLFETTNQGLVFCLTALFAVFLGLICEIAHFFYSKLKHKWLIVSLNAAFSFVITFALFLICLWLNFGEIRLYIVFTYAFGLILSGLLFSKLKIIFVRQKLKNLNKKKKM